MIHNIYEQINIHCNISLYKVAPTKTIQAILLIYNCDTFESWTLWTNSTASHKSTPLYHYDFNTTKIAIDVALTSENTKMADYTREYLIISCFIVAIWMCMIEWVYPVPAGTNINDPMNFRYWQSAA